MKKVQQAVAAPQQKMKVVMPKGTKKAMTKAVQEAEPEQDEEPAPDLELQAPKRGLIGSLKDALGIVENPAGQDGKKKKNTDNPSGDTAGQS